MKTAKELALMAARALSDKKGREIQVLEIGGLRMGVAEENLVVSMAKEAGIKNIYKSYINAQNKLDAYPLKL